jgi:DNA-binding CsgD family transcriptional regulator
MDRSGKIVAIDDSARLAFAQLATLDGARVKDRIWQGLDYVHRCITSVFRGQAEIDGAPSVRFFAHWSGAVLKLRGTLAMGADGVDYVTILVERGETVALRKRRLMLSLGLSPREAEVLTYLAMGKTNSDIATILGISSLTIKKHLEKIYLALNVENRTAAAAVALEGPPLLQD